MLKDTIVCTKHKYIILNALNECIDRENFIVFIRELIHLQHENFRIMITSRSKKNIEKQLNSIANYDINIQSIIVNENIRIYVRNRLVTNSKLKKWSRKVQENIVAILMKKTNDMYVHYLKTLYHFVKNETSLNEFIVNLNQFDNVSSWVLSRKHYRFCRILYTKRMIE